MDGDHSTVMKNMLRFSQLLLPLLCSWTLLACGGSQTEAKPVDTEDQRHDDDYDSTAHIGATAEIGALPEEDSVYAFRESFDAIQECFLNGSKRLDFIGGEISFQVWVNSDGGVETVFAETSTLGDHTTEECMYDALRSAPWPKPVGGPVGVAQNAFEFEMTGDVRPPVAWEGDEIQETLSQSGGRIAECKQGSMEKFLATVYVDTDGTPMSVGMAAPNRHEAANSGCLIDLLSGLSFPSPGSWPAKVSFYL